MVVPACTAAPRYSESTAVNRRADNRAMAPAFPRRGGDGFLFPTFGTCGLNVGLRDHCPLGESG
ncbi:hypothetical protein PUN28_014664 [Cardiocondyla obscurior]|uniref:Uncharacterized protein n=1 Tax=Cardiocondyla obscurior TaxID=286306 RepID=A0AAW2EUS6_9HYME